MRIPTGGLVVLAAVVLTAGCGGGGGGGDRLTKDEYIEAANAICKEANDKLDTLADPTSIEEVASLAEEAVGIQEDALADLRALNPPEADEATLNGAYDLLEQQVDIGKQIQAAAEDGDEAVIQDLIAKIDPINEQADRIAKDYGLTECGSN